MGAEIPQLKNINQAALTFGSIGLQAGAQRHAMEQKYNLDLRNRMMLANQSLQQQMGIAENNYEFQRQAADEKQNQTMKMEDEAMAGQEAAMTDWATNVLGLYEPDSPEYKQAAKTLEMIKSRRRGSTAYNKGYMTFIGDRNIGDMMSQGAAGAAGFQQGKKAKPAAEQKALPKPGPKDYDEDKDLSS
jgi:hypothetical protein